MPVKKLENSQDMTRKVFRAIRFQPMADGFDLVQKIVEEFQDETIDVTTAANDICDCIGIERRYNRKMIIATLEPIF